MKKKQRARHKRLRPGLLTLSLGVDTIAQLEDLWRDYTLVSGGGRAASRSAAVRDMIARAHENLRRRRKR